MSEESASTKNTSNVAEVANSSSPIFTVGVIGASFKTAPIDAREELARCISVDGVVKLKSEHAFDSSEVVLLSTCNRVEIYYHNSYSPARDFPQALESLFKVKGDEQYQIYHYVGPSAVEHLFNVAAGLDSLVMGEEQILSQVREASRLSAERGLSGPITSKLFSRAYESAKRVREDNPNFARGLNNSVSQAVLDFISRKFSGKRPNLLLIGSGKMIRLAVRSIDRSSLGTVTVAARSGKALEDWVEPESLVQLSEIGRAVRENSVDVIITATSAEDYVIRREDIEKSISIKDSKSPLLIIDISVPRNVDPEVASIPEVTLLNIDDLKEYVRPPESEDKEIVEKIKASLAEGVGEFTSWLVEYGEIGLPMAALRRRAEAIREEEFENAISRLPDLTPDERAVIEKMSERLVRRFLHEPTTKLRDLAREHEKFGKARQYTEALTELFSSDYTPKESKQKQDAEWEKEQKK
ncbi:MAG TPA: glutamyl-tRNA reductase [Nitrososphaerales archaeon]|nr:glutamyl-tRNA reductase [Nitrososphaerales archaeon]